MLIQTGYNRGRFSVRPRPFSEPVQRTGSRAGAHRPVEPMDKEMSQSVTFDLTERTQQRLPQVVDLGRLGTARGLRQFALDGGRSRGRSRTGVHVAQSLVVIALARVVRLPVNDGRRQVKLVQVLPHHVASSVNLKVGTIPGFPVGSPVVVPTIFR